MSLARKDGKTHSTSTHYNHPTFFRSYQLVTAGFGIVFDLALENTMKFLRLSILALVALVAVTFGQTQQSQQPQQAQAPQELQPATTNVPVMSVPVSTNTPRVFLQSSSHGSNWNAHRDQSMEMSKDFEKDCPGVRVTLNQQMANYIVALNHIEHGFVRDNQFQIADKNGDLLTNTKEGGSIKGGIKKACAQILADWATKKGTN
jgi:hypothetical protein